MQKFIKFMNEKVSPFAQKLTRNVWISSLQSAIMITLPLTLVGSVISVLSIVNNFIPNFPDFGPINSFSFGMVGIIISFVLPYFILQNKKMNGKKLIAGAASLGLFMMFIFPTFNDAGEMIVSFERFGATGMFLGMLSGYLTGFIFIALDKFSFFKKDGAIPEYIISSFDSFIPVLVVLLIGWLIVTVFAIDFYALLLQVLQPLTIFGQSYFGVLGYVFLTAILYSFGISPWVLYGVFFPIQLAGISENATLVAQGMMPVNIHTAEVVQGFITLGGMGATLPLPFMMMRSKSQKLKALGKATVIPSVFNINEPIVFGTPIILNPIMMIPFWMSSLVSATIPYFALKFGLVSIPSQVFNMWFIPAPIQAFLINYDWRSIVLALTVIAAATVIYYPFFKIYEAQQVELEKEATK